VTSIPSWESGEVQADWKLANLEPSFKKGTKEDPGNNRPVSLTSMPGKIMKLVLLGVTQKHVRDSAVLVIANTCSGGESPA